MKNITTTIILLTTALVLSISTGCKKSDDSRKEFNRIYNCHNQSTPTIENVSTRLVGLWWLHQYDNNISGKTIIPDYDVFIEFKADSTYSVNEDGKEIAVGTWQVKQNPNSYSVDMSTQTAYTYGYIYICAEDMIFDNGNVDGSTNYLSKIYK